MLKQGNCVKRFTAVSTDSLEARTGESLLIRALYVAPESDNDFLSLKVDRKTVGVYRIYGKSGNHLDRINIGFHQRNLMEFLQRKGVNCSIPVAEGQAFTVSSVGTSPVVVIVYDVYTAGDIRADMPNGTDSKEYMFIQYMDSSTSVLTTQTVELDTSLSPPEFPDFPCGKSVPANTEIEILGVVGSPSGTGASGSNYIGTTFVKLVKEREVLFDEDRNGIPFFYIFNDTMNDYSADFTLIGPCVNVRHFTEIASLVNDAPLGDPLMFEPALKFQSGEELLMYLSFVEVGSQDLGDKIDLALIMNVTRS